MVLKMPIVAMVLKIPVGNLDAIAWVYISSRGIWMPQTDIADRMMDNIASLESTISNQIRTSRADGSLGISLSIYLSLSLSLNISLSLYIYIYIYLYLSLYMYMYVSLSLYAYICIHNKNNSREQVPSRREVATSAQSQLSTGRRGFTRKHTYITYRCNNSNHNNY